MFEVPARMCEVLAGEVKEGRSDGEGDKVGTARKENDNPETRGKREGRKGIGYRNSGPPDVCGP